MPSFDTHVIDGPEVHADEYTETRDEAAEEMCYRPESILGILGNASLLDLCDDQPIDFHRAAILADRLRSLSPHGLAYRSYRGAFTNELLAAALRREPLECGEISVLLAGMILVGGAWSRVVTLHGKRHGSSHVLVEMWSTRYKKWAATSTPIIRFGATTERPPVLSSIYLKNTTLTRTETFD